MVGCGRRACLRWLGLLGPPLLLAPLALHRDPAARCAFTVLLMAVYWSLELLPLAVTALLPVVLLPGLGVLGTEPTCRLYMKGTDMFYLGSLMVALGVEEAGLHRRIALKALTYSGTEPASVMLGFMLPTAFLSMWISNAASTAMMVPILEAVLAELGLSRPERTMMMLSVAFSANIGGTATLIGTPPNLILIGFLDERFGDAHPVGFASWMAFAAPLAALNLLLCWLLLQLYFLGWRRTTTRGGAGGCTTGAGGGASMYEAGEGEEARSLVGGGADASRARGSDLRAVLRRKYLALGPMSSHEASLLLLFVLLVLLWFTRKPGFLPGLPGWATALAWPGRDGAAVVIDSASETILVTVLLFALPADWAGGGYAPAGGGNRGLLDWKTVQRRFPWGIILLMGGGFAIAEGAKESCLTAAVGAALASFGARPPAALLLLLCLVTSAISAVASNSATTAMLAPVVLELAQRLGLHPITLALGVTLTASQSFMLPVSTPPNAIVFTAGGLSIAEMAGPGLLMNLLTIVTTILGVRAIGTPLFCLGMVPAWANATAALVADDPCS
jgi:sodium-dependent dicarboxylate transporter 2/3/5